MRVNLYIYFPYCIVRICDKEDDGKVAEIIGNEESMLDRAFMMLEDEEFDEANQMLENVLNINSRNAKAYIGKLMVDLKVAAVEDLAKVKDSFADNKNYKRALKFATAEQKAEFEGYSKAAAPEAKAEKKEEKKEDKKPAAAEKKPAPVLKPVSSLTPSGRVIPTESKSAAASAPVFNTASKDVPDELKGLMINNNAAPVIDIKTVMMEGEGLLEAGQYALAGKKFDQVIEADPNYAKAYMCKLCTEMKVPVIDALITVKTSFADNANYKKALECVTDPMERFQYESLNPAGFAAMNEKVKKAAEEKSATEKKQAEEEKKRAEEEKKKAVEEYAKLTKKNGKAEEKAVKKEEKAAVKAEKKEEPKAAPKAEVKKEEPKAAPKPEIKKEEPKAAPKPEIKKEEPKAAPKPEIKKEEPKAAEKKEEAAKVESVNNADFKITPEDLVKSAFTMFANNDFDKSESLLDKAIVLNPKLAKAYIGKLMCDLKVSKEENLLKRSSAFDDNENYKKAVEYAQGDEKKKYIGYSEAVKKNIINVEKRTVRLAVMPTVLKAFDTPISIAVNAKNKECVIICNRERTQIDATAYGADSKWDDIIQVASAAEHMVGLRSDGGAYAVGINDDNRCNTVNWKDVTDIFVGKDISVGLKTDGTVFAVGNDIVDMWDALSWKNVKDVAVGDGFIISVDNNGDVNAVGSNASGQCNVDMWERVVAVAAGSKHSAALCADGTVLATGNNDDAQCNVDDWKDIVKIEADGNATFGLKIDGTVVAAGFKGQEYKKWRDIIAIYAGNGHIVGAKTDGTLVSDPADLTFNKQQLKMYKDTAADIMVKVLSTAKKLTEEKHNPFAAKLLKTVVNPDDKELYAMCENKEIPIDEIIYVKAGQLKDEGLSDAAKTAYEILGDYKDSAQLKLVCNVGVVEHAYKEATECIKKGDYYTANYLLNKYSEYTDTTPELEEVKAAYIIAAFNKGTEAMDRQTYKIAKSIIATADLVDAKVSDSKLKEKINESRFSFKAVAYEKAAKAMEDEMYYDNAKELLNLIGDFKDSKEMLEKCEKGLKERAVKEAALNEQIEKAKVEAAKKQREAELKSQLDSLNEELESMSSQKFFGIKIASKSRKTQIEEQIKVIQDEIDSLNK